MGHCSKFCRERITGIIYIECSLFSLFNVLMLDNLSNIERYHPIPYKNGMISNCKLAQIVPTYNTAMWALICPRFLVFMKQKRQGCIMVTVDTQKKILFIPYFQQKKELKVVTVQKSYCRCHHAYCSVITKQISINVIVPKGDI